MKYYSLDEVGQDYIAASQDETDAMFAQGEVVLNAANQGYTIKDVVKHCASLTRRQTRTVFMRYAVAKTFPSDKRDDGLDWYMHALCASTSDPYKWLALAADGYVDEHGKHHGHTSRTLKAAIKATGESDPDKHKPIMLLDSVEAYVMRADPYECHLFLSLKGGSFPVPEWEGQTVRITLMQANAVELEKAMQS